MIISLKLFAFGFSNGLLRLLSAVVGLVFPSQNVQSQWLMA
jgi:hypothetical protein